MPYPFDRWNFLGKLHIKTRNKIEVFGFWALHATWRAGADAYQLKVSLRGELHGAKKKRPTSEGEARDELINTSAIALN